MILSMNNFLMLIKGNYSAEIVSICKVFRSHSFIMFIPKIFMACEIQMGKMFSSFAVSVTLLNLTVCFVKMRMNFKKIRFILLSDRERKD